ncbi:hypothetical protein AVEN_205466-1 [Araneus ventricosus]|uniref:Uncharacterized protein n=1 Tax=Araneus ventricosus TaxID=182803 RepID=A0A4Y2CBS3_ARAVE|nr:hypothetical protein AVEN_205466-1 [Araneus ventricosus]
MFGLVVMHSCHIHHSGMEQIMDKTSTNSVENLVTRKFFGDQNQHHIYYIFTMNTDEEPIARRWRMTKERKARWLARQSQESHYRIRAVDAAAYRRCIEAETPTQSQARRERDGS